MGGRMLLPRSSLAMLVSGISKECLMGGRRSHELRPPMINYVCLVL